MQNKNYFEGWYFKQQKDDYTICFIVGKSSERAFIQVIANDFSNTVYYDLKEYNANYRLMQIRVGDSIFSMDGCIVDIVNDDLCIMGRVSYTDITPIKGDIMGPFRFLPKMECRHGVYSLDHKLTGSMEINGSKWDFTGGKGYIEGDRGTSFPRGYYWCQCNDFDTKTSIMAAVATIPYMGISFTGTICSIYFHGREFRLATYWGAKVLKVRKDSTVITQGKLRLEISAEGGFEYPLSAPKSGKMSDTVYESVGTFVHFKMFENGLPLFNIKSANGCLEYTSINKIKL